MIKEWLCNNKLEDIEFNIDFIPPFSQRKKWANISDNVKKGIITKADELLDFEFNSIPATDALDFSQKGIRCNYEEKSFAKRNALALLVLAECVDNNNKYINNIINGIWSICEESFWGISAHMDGYALPNVAKPVVDLFSAQTANLLVMTKLVLGEKLNQITPIITQRIDLEINKRIVLTFLNRTDWKWMGYENHKVNNWNPWILSNILPVFVSNFCLNIDKEDNFRCIEKSLNCIDAFINSNDYEGSCDEGCSYWGYGALCLFDFLEFLYLSSNCKINFFNEQKIRNMFEYIYKVYIGKNYFVNFADASATPCLDIITIYRMAKRIDNKDLISFARLLYSEKTDQNNPEYITLRRHLFDLFSYDEFINTKPLKIKNSFYLLSDIQVALYRYENIFIAVKGGNNNENHNHNDVGNFILYSKNKPVIIDIGVGVYTKKTFSKDRYSIFTMQSDYHNLPVINGISQKEGEKSFAKNFNICQNEGEICVSMNLENCYKNQKFTRSFCINKGDFCITDLFKNANVKMHFITATKPKLTENGFICEDVELICSTPHLSKIEEIKIHDKRLLTTWGNNLFRVVFEFDNTSEIKYKFCTI